MNTSLAARVVARQPRLRDHRARAGHDLGRPGVDHGRPFRAQARDSPRPHGHPRADGADRAGGDRGPRSHPARRSLAQPGPCRGSRSRSRWPTAPLWTGLGIVAGYLGALLGLSFYIRRRIGPRLWRQAHRLTIVVYGLAVAHTLGAGTDASTPWMRVWLFATAPVIAVLFVARMVGARRKTKSARTAEPPAAGEHGPARHHHLPGCGAAGPAISEDTA